MKRKYKITFFTISIIIIASIILSSCSKKSASIESKMENTSGAPGNSQTADFAVGEKSKEDAISKDGTKSLDGSKIILSASVELETKDFSKSTEGIISSVKGKGGFVQSSNIYGSEDTNSRGANYIIRIPKNYFEDFLINIGNLGKVVGKSTQGNDISSQYYDTEAHLKALKIQEERLLELLKKSGSLKDILEIENQLSNVRYQIESLTTNLKNWDNLVDYTTISLNIHEVKELTSNPITLGDKVKSTFTSSIKSLGSLFRGLLLVVVALIPYLIIIIPLSILLMFIIKKKKRKE